MKRTLSAIMVISLFLLSLPSGSFGQVVGHDESKELLDVARKIMESAPTCALVTIDMHGLPSVRTMDPFGPEQDFTVWLGTNPMSRKVKEIEKNPNVALYYQDADGSGYVVIHGKAQLVNNQEEKDQRWKSGWEAFYPDKSSGYLLIKVIPESLEVVSYAYGIVGDADTWKAPVIKFKKKDQPASGKE